MPLHLSCSKESNKDQNRNLQLVLPIQKKRRSLNISDANPPLLEFGACGKRPAVTFYKDKIHEEWFQSSNSLCTTAIQMDFGWFLTRLCTHQLFSENLHNRDGEVFQPLPSWSGFNAKIVSEPPPLTSVGYCPIINGSPTEYSTVYTVKKNVQAMMDVLHQKHSVITFDLAIYMKAKEIQWRRPEEFENTVIRMGGFHITYTSSQLLERFSRTVALKTC